jgi:OOP family OmpA-OmpF porin
VVQPQVVDLRGQTGNRQARAEISRILSEKLGDAADYRINVTYVEELDPTLNIPTPEECVERLNAVQERGGKLSFAPGELVLEDASTGALTDVVKVLRDCDRVIVEVGGHTDSQGREEMNAELSQQRAEAVRLALIERGIPPDQLVSAGYGETQPIASNDTEEGREANRRIAFTLAGRRAKDAAPAQVTLDQAVDELSDEETEEDEGADVGAPENGEDG